MIFIISVIAYIINVFCNSNLMFISQNYPGTFIEIIYNISGAIFPIVMIVAQSTLPFCIVYGIYKAILTKRVEKTHINTDNTEKEKIYN